MSIFRASNVPARRQPVAPIYDEDEYEDEWEDAEAPEATELADPLLEDEEEDIAMLAVEERIEAANYLRALLTADLFGGDAATAAVRVQRMVRSILRRELEILLGLKQREEVAAVVESPFSVEEVSVLKLLAARARSPAVAAAPAPVSVRPVTVAPPPPPVTVATPKRPQVTPVDVQRSPAPAKAAPAPAKKPPQREKAAKPSQQRERVAKAEAAPAPKPRPDPNNPSVDPVSGMHVEMKGEVRRTKNGRIKRTLMVDGQQITNDLTPQVINPNRLPMPQGAQFTAITQMQASETVAAQGNKAAQIAATALQS